MGRPHVDIIIHSESNSAVVNALADTAATFTKVPRLVFDELGLEAAPRRLYDAGDAGLQGQHGRP